MRTIDSEKKNEQNRKKKHIRSWRSNRNGGNWRRISANNCDNFIAIHFETGMKTYHNIIRENSLRFLCVCDERKNPLELCKKYRKEELWWEIHWKILLVSCRIPSMVIPVERSILLCPTFGKHYFGQSQRKPNQKMAQWISFQSVRIN